MFSIVIVDLLSQGMLLGSKPLLTILMEQESDNGPGEDHRDMVQLMPVTAERPH
jgi:hypothetical protein